MVIHMQRYFVSDESIENQTIVFTGNEAHHIGHVMRLAVDDEIIVTTDSGHAYRARLVSFTKKEVTARIVEALTIKDNTLNVSLAMALIKKDAFELVLQKATELGVKEIYPIRTKRSIIKIDDFAKKQQRYQTIVKEASEQSERSHLPTIHDQIDLDALPFERFDHVFLAYERLQQQNLRELLETVEKTHSVLVIIGPEGGFADEEIAGLPATVQHISLGETILRSETAAIYSLSVLRYHLGG